MAQHNVPELPQAVKDQVEKERPTNPQFLHKYRSGDEYHLKALRENKIWVSSPESLNDPHDCRPEVTTELAVQWHDAIVTALPDAFGEIRFIPSVIAVQFTEDERAKLRSHYEKLASDLQHDIAQMGVFCLCSDPLNEPMWTYYANGHKGFCIEYPFNKETFDFEFGRWPARPMDYRDQYPHMDMGVLIREPIEVVKAKFFFYKWAKYQLEKEWRCTFTSGNVTTKSPPMSSIIFGAQPSDKLIADVTAAIGGHESPPVLKRLVRKRFSYEYEIVPLA
jgi:hypothetical protein